MKRIGIDIGTTTISAVVLDDAGKEVLESRTLSNESFLRTGNEWERLQDVGRIVECAKDALDDLLERYPDTAAIGLTGQMHGIVYVNREGKAVSPLYTWQDQRGNIPEFAGKTLVELIREQCGVGAATGYGLVTHAYLCKKKEVPEGAVSLCTIPDYLGMLLTERAKPLLHISMAASLGFFNTQKGVFRRDKLEECGISCAILPEVTDRFAVLGSYRGRPVTVAIGDNQASFLGSVGFEENTPLLNVGTGGQISVLSRQFFEAEGIEARPLTADQFLLVGSSLCGGRAYAILEKFFRSYAVAAGMEDQPQYDAMAELAKSGMKLSDNMRVVTAFHGTRANPDLRGSIHNLSEDNFTPAGMTAGVLKGMAQELYDMYACIREGTGIQAKKLVASGNGVRKNAVLRDIFEEMFQAKLELARYQEEAACGAAISIVLK